MGTIPSFRIDHTKLEKGVYVSRTDTVGGETVTTYDIRVTRPYRDEPMTAAGAHTIEHIGATLLRNGPMADDVIYFGPMGCMTGFYLILKGTRTRDEVEEEVWRLFRDIKDWEGKAVPGAGRREECGNCTMHDRYAAWWYAMRFTGDRAGWGKEYAPLDDTGTDKKESNGKG